MANIKITMIVECDNIGEYDEVLSRLQAHLTSDGRFEIESIAQDTPNLEITAVYDPTLQEV